jgi:hypothetical protein
MKFTMDTCVMLNAMSKEEDNAASRRFVTRLAKTREEVVQPAGFLLEMLRTVSIKKTQQGLDLSYLADWDFIDLPSGLQMHFREVTVPDIVDFWTLEPEAMTAEEWQSRLVGVKPAYDIEYAIVAWKSESVLVSTDERLLRLAGGIDARHPRDVN